MRFIVAAEDGSLRRIDANGRCNAADKSAPLPESRELYRGNTKKRIQCMTSLTFPSQSRGDVDAVAAAFKDGSVSIIDADTGDVLASIPPADIPIADARNTADEEVSVVSIECLHGYLATCTSSGHARMTSLSSLWSSSGPETIDIELPAPISVMRMHPTRPGTIALGGKENDLQVWASQNSNGSQGQADENESDEDEDDSKLWTTMKPIWKAKNVKNDELDLRVPIWISDLQFLPTEEAGGLSDNYRILTTTRFRQVRIYDSKQARRPVHSLELSNYPISQVLLAGDHADEVHAIFTDTHANIIHTNISKGTILGAFKGFSGAVNSINLSSHGSNLLAGGMDTYLRLFNVEDHHQICSVYIGSRIIQCLQLPEEVVIKDEEDDSAEFGDEDDDVWEGLEEVEEPQTKRVRRS